jgi:hypothetical protein
MVRIQWRPGARDLRKFGAVLIAGFGLVGLAFYAGWPVAARPGLALGLWIGGGAAGLLGLTGTRAALPVYWAWMGVAFVLGNIVSRIAVGAVFFLVVTPFALAMRVAGRDALRLRRDRSARTYWRDLEPTPGRDAYERQF